MYVHSVFSSSEMFLLLLCIVLQARKVLCQNDPCSNYTAVNDSTMITDYNQTSTLCRSNRIPVGWTRFVATQSGLITTTCPTSPLCGCDQQIWIKDRIPTQPGTMTNVSLCISTSQGCCTRMTQPMQIKTCNGFLVFDNPVVPFSTRICFANSSVQLPKFNLSSTAQPTTTTEPSKTTTDVTVTNATTTDIVSSSEEPQTSIHRPGEATKPVLSTRETSKDDFPTSPSPSSHVTQDGFKNVGLNDLRILLGVTLALVCVILLILIVYITSRQYRKRQNSVSEISSICQPDKVAKTKFINALLSKS